MSRTAEDVEDYLLQLDRRFDFENGTYLVSGSVGSPPIAIRVAPPIVAFRVAVGPAPSDPSKQVSFFRKLLELNASDLIHAAYGIEENTIILAAALELENLDLNEMEALLCDIDLALIRHTATLRAMAGTASS